MPVIPGRHCSAKQPVRAELVGLLVTCEKCGKEFRAKPPEEPAPHRDATRTRDGAVVVEVADEPVGFMPILKGVALTAGLSLLGVLVLGAIILLVRKSEEPKTAPTGQHAKYKETAGEREKKSEEDRARSAESEKSTVAAAGLAAALLALVLAFLYVMTVLLSGAWVARDAYARGLNGLGWATFCYLFHLIVRLVVLPFATLPNLILPGIGLLVLLFAEPVAWLGFGVYLYARPWGKKTSCPSCYQGRLNYLVQCPRCGTREEAEGD